VLGLLAHCFHGFARPALHELGVALLKLQEPQATCEELLGRPGALLLQPHELEPAFGKPEAAALGCGEVFAESFVGVALNLCDLVGVGRGLIDISGVH
jgi:hypothetical protein